MDGRGNRRDSGKGVGLKRKRWGDMLDGRGTDGVGWKRCWMEEETDGMVEEVLDGRGNRWDGGKGVGWKRNRWDGGKGVRWKRKQMG